MEPVHPRYGTNTGYGMLSWILVLDGQKQADPEGCTYASVVSRESVRIALTHETLSGLEVCAADIHNAYLQTPSSNKDYIICCPDFGIEHEGKVALIHRALYGGKTAQRDFRNHLRSCMHFLNFKSCPADPDGCAMQLKVTAPKYDSLVLSDNAESILRNEMGKYFELNRYQLDH
jgi:hypothetical protein